MTRGRINKMGANYKPLKKKQKTKRHTVVFTRDEWERIDAKVKEHREAGRRNASAGQVIRDLVLNHL